MKLHVRVGDTAYDLDYSCDPDLPVSWLMSQVMRDVDEAHHVIELQAMTYGKPTGEPADLGADLCEVFQGTPVGT